MAGHARDLDMVERAQHSRRRAAREDDPGSWVISPRLEPLRDRLYGDMAKAGLK